MKTMKGYKIDLSNYPDIFLISLENEINSDLLKEKISKNILRMELNPQYRYENQYGKNFSEYLIIDIKNSVAYCNNLILDKENKSIDMDIIFDDNSEYLYDDLVNKKLVVELRGTIDRKTGNMKLITFDFIRNIHKINYKDKEIILL